MMVGQELNTEQHSLVSGQLSQRVLCLTVVFWPTSGFKLLPETYVVLIYAFMNLDVESGPDLETASSLLESMKVPLRHAVPS